MHARRLKSRAQVVVPGRARLAAICPGQGPTERSERGIEGPLRGDRIASRAAPAAVRSCRLDAMELRRRAREGVMERAGSAAGTFEGMNPMASERQTRSEGGKNETNGGRESHAGTKNIAPSATPKGKKSIPRLNDCPQGDVPTTSPGRSPTGGRRTRKRMRKRAAERATLTNTERAVPNELRWRDGQGAKGSGLLS